MDLLTFLSIVLPAYAWPILFLIAAILLRKSIEKKVGAVTSIKWKDVVIRFGKPGLAKTRAPRQLNPTVSLRGAAHSVGQVLGADLQSLAPEIVFKHASDGIALGLNEGYPSIRHRQNTAAYY